MKSVWKEPPLFNEIEWCNGFIEACEAYMAVNNPDDFRIFGMIAGAESVRSSLLESQKEAMDFDAEKGIKYGYIWEGESHD